jgi:hypothetical protein
VAQGVGPEFKSQYWKKKKKDRADMETRGPLEGANKEGSRNRMVKGHMKYLPFVGHLI